jgi:hypothetical protein
VILSPISVPLETGQFNSVGWVDWGERSADRRCILALDGLLHSPNVPGVAAAFLVELSRECTRGREIRRDNTSHHERSGGSHPYGLAYNSSHSGRTGSGRSTFHIKEAGSGGSRVLLSYSSCTSNE